MLCVNLVNSEGWIVYARQPYASDTYCAVNTNLITTINHLSSDRVFMVSSQQGSCWLQGDKCGGDPKWLCWCCIWGSFCYAWGEADDLLITAGCDRGESEEQWCVLCTEAVFQPHRRTARIDWGCRIPYPLDEWSSRCVLGLSIHSDCRQYKLLLGKKKKKVVCNRASESSSKVSCFA